MSQVKKEIVHDYDREGELQSISVRYYDINGQIEKIESVTFLPSALKSIVLFEKGEESKIIGDDYITEIFREKNFESRISYKTIIDNRSEMERFNDEQNDILNSIPGIEQKQIDYNTHKVFTTMQLMYSTLTYFNEKGKIIKIESNENLEYKTPRRTVSEFFYDNQDKIIREITEGNNNKHEIVYKYLANNIIIQKTTSSLNESEDKIEIEINLENKINHSEIINYVYILIKEQDKYRINSKCVSSVNNNKVELLQYDVSGWLTETELMNIEIEKLNNFEAKLKSKQCSEFANDLMLFERSYLYLNEKEQLIEEVFYKYIYNTEELYFNELNTKPESKIKFRFSYYSKSDWIENVLKNVHEYEYHK